MTSINLDVGISGQQDRIGQGFAHPDEAGVGNAYGHILKDCRKTKLCPSVPRYFWLCDFQKQGYAIKLFRWRNRNMLISKDNLSFLLHGKMFTRNVVGVIVRDNDQMSVGYP